MIALSPRHNRYLMMDTHVIAGLIKRKPNAPLYVRWPALKYNICDLIILKKVVHAKCAHQINMKLNT